MKPNIIVTGSQGQLGNEIRDLHSDLDFNWIFADRNTLDLEDPDAIHAIFEKFRPKWFVNCAAYTAVDKAESDREKAFAVNATAPLLIAKECTKYGTALIQISTDYVFNGNGTEPYLPEGKTDPVNYYGQTKLQGEKNALEFNAKTIIIRTSWVYSIYGKNFVKTMRHLMRARPEINVVSDQKGCPTYAKDLASAIIDIISSGKEQWGIYHFSNEGDTTWYDFAVAINDLSGYGCKINSISTAQFPTPAKRPAYSVMDISKIMQIFHITPRYWVLSLKECINRLEASNIEGKENQ